MGGFDPPKADFSRLPGVVMLHLRPTGPRRVACLAGKREKSVKWVNSRFLWYILACRSELSAPVMKRKTAKSNAVCNENQVSGESGCYTDQHGEQGQGLCQQLEAGTQISRIELVLAIANPVAINPVVAILPRAAETDVQRA